MNNVCSCIYRYSHVVEKVFGSSGKQLLSSCLTLYMLKSLGVETTLQPCSTEAWRSRKSSDKAGSKSSAVQEFVSAVVGKN